MGESWQVAASLAQKVQEGAKVGTRSVYEYSAVGCTCQGDITTEHGAQHYGSTVGESAAGQRKVTEASELLEIRDICHARHAEMHIVWNERGGGGIEIATTNKPTNKKDYIRE